MLHFQYDVSQVPQSPFKHNKKKKPWTKISRFRLDLHWSQTPGSETKHFKTLKDISPKLTHQHLLSLYSTLLDFQTETELQRFSWTTEVDEEFLKKEKVKKIIIKYKT